MEDSFLLLLDSDEPGTYGMLTILMRMTNLLLRTQFMHAILFGQCNGQCKWRPINWTIEISVKRVNWSISVAFNFTVNFKRTFVYASILSSCHRNALAKRIPFRLPFGVPFLVASVEQGGGGNRGEKKRIDMSIIAKWNLVEWIMKTSFPQIKLKLEKKQKKKHQIDGG